MRLAERKILVLDKMVRVHWIRVIEVDGVEVAEQVQCCPYQDEARCGAWCPKFSIRYVPGPKPWTEIRTCGGLHFIDEVRK